jgi:hypothetical protein
VNHADFAHADGAYVLGTLSPEEREAFEEHLRVCDECAESVRAIGWLPELLGRVDASAVDSPDDPPAVPDTLLPRLHAEVRRSRRRRLVWTLAGAAAAALIAVVGVAAWVQDEGTPVADPEVAVSPPPAVEMQQVDQEVVQATLVMESVAWGTRLDLTCSYIGGGDPYASEAPPSYVLVVHTRDGRTERVGTWRAVPGRTTTLSGATAAEAEEITSVDVRTMDGKPVLRLVS